MIGRDRDFMLFGADENSHAFKGVLLFLGVYLGASLFAAVFTPPVYWFFAWLNENFQCGLWQYLARKKVDVYYDRLRWIPIIVSLPLIFKECGLMSLRRLGISFDARGARLALRFALFGILTTAFIAALQTIFVGRHADSARLASVLASSLLGAVVLGFLEEIVFRGLIMRCFYSAFGTVSAVVLSSLFFAYKHFKVPSRVVREMLPQGGRAADWDTGFVVCYYDTVGIFHSFSAIAFLSLFLLACMLCVFYLKTKSLVSPIFFHAGIVFVMLTLCKAFPLDCESSFIFGSSGITDGLVCFLTLLALNAYALFFMKTSKRRLD